MNRFDATADRARWPVMVLAHNEERQIAACLDSIFDAEPGRAFDVFVMANGCTDRTEEIVRAYGSRRPGAHLVSIAMPRQMQRVERVRPRDRAHACCGPRRRTFSSTGTRRILPGSLTRLAEGLAAQIRMRTPHRRRPLPGEAWKRIAGTYSRSDGLVANLYALRGTFVRTLRNRRVRFRSGSKATTGCSVR